MNNIAELLDGVGDKFTQILNDVNEINKNNTNEINKNDKNSRHNLLITALEKVYKEIGGDISKLTPPPNKIFEAFRLCSWDNL